MVLEDGPRWDYGDDDEMLINDDDDGQGVMMDAEEARRQAYLRLASLKGEERAIGEKAEAAAWLLKDVVQGFDWAHSMTLHTEAAR